MEPVTLYFLFKNQPDKYSEFLETAHNIGCASVIDITADHYPTISGYFMHGFDNLVVEVKADEEQVILLKLKFGFNISKKPKPLVIKVLKERTPNPTFYITVNCKI